MSDKIFVIKKIYIQKGYYFDLFVNERRVLYFHYFQFFLIIPGLIYRKSLSSTQIKRLFFCLDLQQRPQQRLHPVLRYPQRTATITTTFPLEMNGIMDR